MAFINWTALPHPIVMEGDPGRFAECTEQECEVCVLPRVSYCSQTAVNRLTHLQSPLPVQSLLQQTILNPLKLQWPIYCRGEWVHTRGYCMV